MTRADARLQCERRLPLGFEVRLRPDLVRAGGELLVGGSPLRAVRLSRRARALLTGDRLVVEGPASGALARRLLDGNLADPVVDDIDVPQSDLTVVVPVRDRAAQLDRCLAALVPLRVVVVDDASRDPAAVARVAQKYGAEILPLDHNVGPAGARNAGLRQVRTPLVAFVDSDVVVDGSVLLDLARHGTDPWLALVAPRVTGAVRTGRPRWFERYDVARSSLDLGCVGAQVKPGTDVGWLPSACLVGRVAHLRSGFDEALRVGEDVDLVWRLVGAGFVVRYDPSRVAHHDVRTSVRGWLGRKFAYGTSGAELASRHGDAVAPARLSITTAIGAAALLQRRWWSMPIAGATAVVTARSLRRSLPRDENSTRIAVRLALRGLGWGVRQEAGLLLRHWWPVALLAAPLSRSVRRAVLTAVLLDLAMFLRERPRTGPLAAVVARRLDDLAYGAGLWVGAARSRSMRCLMVRRPSSTSA